MRDFKREGKRLIVNGRTVFLRARLEVVTGQNVLSFDKPTTVVTFKDFTLTPVKRAGVYSQKQQTKHQEETE